MRTSYALVVRWIALMVVATAPLSGGCGVWWVYERPASSERTDFATVPLDGIVSEPPDPPRISIVAIRRIDAGSQSGVRIVFAASLREDAPKQKTLAIQQDLAYWLSTIPLPTVEIVSPEGETVELSEAVYDVVAPFRSASYSVVEPTLSPVPGKPGLWLTETVFRTVKPLAPGVYNVRFRKGTMQTEGGESVKLDTTWKPLDAGLATLRDR